jgi:hypothetical protein
MGRSRGGAARCNFERCSTSPAAGPAGTARLLAAGHGGSGPAQRDQATSAADQLERRPRAGFGSGRLEQASSRSKRLKAPLVEGAERSRNDHADIGLVEKPSTLNSNRGSRVSSIVTVQILISPFDH